MSTGKGSKSRYLRIVATEASGKKEFYYNKKRKVWNPPITEEYYKKFFEDGRITVYAGTKRLEWKIYKKGQKTRVEFAIIGRVQVSKAFNPLGKSEDRHITRLADLMSMRHLTGAFLDRMFELFGYLPGGAKAAVNRALNTFQFSKMPQEWQINIHRKQEPTPPFSREAAEAINIDDRLNDGKTFYVCCCMIINKLYLIGSFPVLACPIPLSAKRIRAPPKEIFLPSCPH